MLAIRADGNETIGMGHFMRCISIAKELIKNNQLVYFLISDFSDTNVLADNGIIYFRLTDKNIPYSIQVRNWMLEHKCHTILVDTYEISPEDFDVLSQVGKVIYIDDLYAFDYNCSVIINYNIEASHEFYSNSRYNRQLFLGLDYFPLREEFCKVKNHDIRRNVSKVLITTGSTDDYHAAYNILSTLVNEYDYIEFYVLLGLYYKESYKRKLLGVKEIHDNVKLIPWGQNMAVFLTQFDLVLGPGSTIIFEALSMNVPCISFEFVSNHHEQCVAMDEKHMVPFLGNMVIFDSALKDKILKLFKEELEYDRRKNRAQSYGRYFDKKGVKRIADIIRG